MFSQKVSVIIRTYNEGLYITNLLRAIKQQEYPNIEIILVDSESTDDTVKLAEQYCDKIVGIKKSDFTFGYSLNKGIENSTGDFLVLVSAHTEPCDNTWITNLISPLLNPNIIMVYGKQIGDKNSRYPEFTDLNRTFADKPKTLNAPNYFSHNANSSLTKRAWEQYKFNEFLSGQEDIDWAKHWMKQGFSVYYEPKASIVHSHHETWKQIRHRFHRESKAMKTIGVTKDLSTRKLIISEIKRAANDLKNLKKQQTFTAPIKDVLFYRSNKIIGTISGMLQRNK